MSDVTMRILLSANSGNTLSVIQNVASSLKGDLTNAIAGVGFAAAGLAVGLGVQAVKAAGDFQQAMLNNVAHAGLAKDQLNSVSQSVLDMAPAVGQDPTQLAQALYPILSSLSGMTDQSGKAKVALAELGDAAKSVAGTTTSTTDVANAASAAFNAYGLATNNTSTNIARMNNLFDVMNNTVSAGNMQWSQYATVVGKLSVTSHSAGVSFNEQNAALATLTNSGYSAQLGATYLSNLFTQLDLKTDSLAKNAKKLGISFDEQKFKSMNLSQQIQYLNEITGGNSSKILKLMNNNSTAARTFSALSGSINQYKGNLDSLNHSQGATQQAFQTNASGFNFAMQRLQAAGQVLLITLGNKLLPVITNIVNAIAPAISAFASWLTKSHVLDNAMNELGVLFQLIGQQIMPELSQAWNSLFTSIQPILPQLQTFAMVIGGVVVVSILLAARTFGALVQIFSGAIQVLANLVAFFVDLFTGNFKKLGPDLQGIWNGIMEMLQGFFGALANNALAWGGQFIGGFISGITSKVGGIGSAISGGLGAIGIHIPGFASGVQNFGGGLAVVGENGPELVTLPQGSSVYPLQGSGGGGASFGGQSASITINVSGVIGDKQALVTWIEKELSQRLRRSGNFTTITSGGKAGF